MASPRHVRDCSRPITVSPTCPRQLFFTFKMPFISELNESLFHEESAINELSETVHMALFLVMVIFLGTCLYLVRIGALTEEKWRGQRERLFEKEYNDESSAHLEANRHRRTMVSKLMEAQESHEMAEQAIFARLRLRLFDQKKDIGVCQENFDFAQYLAGSQGRILGELIEIPITTFGPSLRCHSHTCRSPRT